MNKFLGINLDKILTEMSSKWQAESEFYKATPMILIRDFNKRICLGWLGQVRLYRNYKFSSGRKADCFNFHSEVHEFKILDSNARHPSEGFVKQITALDEKIKQLQSERKELIEKEFKARRHKPLFADELEPIQQAWEELNRKFK